MTRKTFLSLFCFLFGLFAARAQQVAKTIADNRINFFPLADVRITGGQFRHIQDLDHEYLLTLDPDRLLSWFRREAGLVPKAQPYPFWESEDVWGGGPLAGHIMGFYLSSMSMMYQTTADPRIIERLKYTLAGLKEAQDAQGDGYLLATINGRQVFEDVVAGNFKTSNPLINKSWEPVYIMNKIMLGLYNAYTLCQLEEAKPILQKMADWFGEKVMDRLSHDDLQKLLVCEHGSINESYVDVYAITGDARYLRWAERLNDEDMWVPLSKGEDVLNGWHANTQIPKFTGFNAVYRYTNDTAYRNAANFFWNIVVKKHTWINGGNSTGEHFFEEAMFEKKLPQFGGPESCNSVNMMRLTESLYETDGRPERIDYYERVLYNHILANYDPEEGMACYYTSMRPGHYKIYGTKYHSFWCCTGTGLEAPAKFAKMIYTHKDNALYVNLFIPSELNWKEKGITVKQSTRFPDENQSVLTIHTASPQQALLKIRVPYWAEKSSLVLKLNGKKIKAVKQEDGYLGISRNWSDKDELSISFTPQLEVLPLKESNRYYAAQYGPIVLGARIDNTNIEKSNFRNARRTVADVLLPMSEVPAFIGPAEAIGKDIKHIPGAELKFVYAPKEGKGMELVPFNRIHFSRYALYMIRVNDMEEYRRTVRDSSVYTGMETGLAGRRTDGVKMGDADSEQMHRMEAVSSSAGRYTLTEMYRRATNGGYFMYNLKSSPDRKQSLYLAFRADDQDELSFDVLVNGRVIKSFTRSGKTGPPATAYFAETIPIPLELTKGKKDITVKIAARSKSMTGDVLDIGLLSE